MPTQKVGGRVGLHLISTAGTEPRRAVHHGEGVLLPQTLTHLRGRTSERVFLFQDNRAGVREQS